MDIGAVDRLDASVSGTSRRRGDEHLTVSVIQISVVEGQGAVPVADLPSSAARRREWGEARLMKVAKNVAFQVMLF